MVAELCASFVGNEESDHTDGKFSGGILNVFGGGEHRFQGPSRLAHTASPPDSRLPFAGDRLRFFHWIVLGSIGNCILVLDISADMIFETKP